MSHKTSKRNFFQRILGKPITGGPADDGCWQLDGAQLRIDLARAEELASPFGAISLEGETLAHPVLILRDGQDGYHAFENKCAHGGRKLDPVPGTETVCCCSVGKSIFDYEGRVLGGSAEGPLKIFPVTAENGSLIVDLA
jgi:nitrite reductase/ring-hydroxylating ferredoxin subunit